MTSTAAGDFTVVSVQTTEAAAGALADWMRATFALEPVEVRRPGVSPVWLDLYFEAPAAARRAAAALGRRRDVRGCAVRACPARNWMKFWRRHFHTQRIGGRLRIVPVWERGRLRPLRGVRNLYVDPGLSFGTGDHFTTHFCLEMVDRLCAEAKGRPRTMLDAGAGSGILALAAVKLGVPRVEAFDFDPQAVEQARKNLRLNRAGTRVRMTVADITAWTPPRRYDLVCANLFGGLLIQAAPVLAAAARRHIVLSGIRESEVGEVSAAFAAQGWNERLCDGDGEWCGLWLVPRA